MLEGRRKVPSRTWKAGYLSRAAGRIRKRSPAQPTQSKTPSRQNRPNVTFYASGLWLDSATCEGGREKLVATSRRRYGIDEQIPEAALFWVLRIGAPWRDLPEAFGPYTTCYNRIQLASARPWLRHWCRWKVFTATFQYAEISAWRGHSPRQDVIFVRDCPCDVVHEQARPGGRNAQTPRNRRTARPAHHTRRITRPNAAPPCAPARPKGASTHHRAGRPLPSNRPCRAR